MIVKCEKATSSSLELVIVSIAENEYITVIITTIKIYRIDNSAKLKTITLSEIS